MTYIEAYALLQVIGANPAHADHAQVIQLYIDQCRAVLAGSLEKAPSYLPVYFAIEEISEAGYQAESNAVCAYVMKLNEEVNFVSYWGDVDTQELKPISGEDVA